MLCHPNHARPRVDQDGTGKIRTELQWILYDCLVPTIPVGNPQRYSSSDVHLQAESTAKIKDQTSRDIVSWDCTNPSTSKFPTAFLPSCALDCSWYSHDPSRSWGQTHRTNEHLQLCNWSSSKVPPSELHKIGKIIELSDSSSRFNILAKKFNEEHYKIKNCQGNLSPCYILLASARWVAKTFQQHFSNWGILKM
jgi:hypothetical protein